MTIQSVASSVPCAESYELWVVQLEQDFGFGPQSTTKRVSRDGIDTNLIATCSPLVRCVARHTDENPPCPIGSASV